MIKIEIAGKETFLTDGEAEVIFNKLYKRLKMKTKQQLANMNKRELINYHNNQAMWTPMNQIKKWNQSKGALINRIVSVQNFKMGR